MLANQRNGGRRLSGLSASTLQLLETAGYINSRNGADSGYTFQDLLLLRTLRALHAARVSTRVINRTLRQLRAWLDGGAVSRLTLDTGANGIRVRDGAFSWEPASGQYALPLERPAFEAHVIPIETHEKTMKKKHSAAHGHYLRGSELEEEDIKAARLAYESCLAGDCTHLEARINLGRLLHLEGLLREAEEIYRGTEEPSAVLYFNLGVLLEDLKREMDAIEAYRQAIVHDPAMADAHFNLSLVHQRLGEAQASFRHLLAYRRLVEAHRSTTG